MTYFGVGLEHFWISTEELLMKYFWNLGNLIRQLSDNHRPSIRQVIQAKLDQRQQESRDWVIRR
mgnify:CR=1 FL=1